MKRALMLLALTACASSMSNNNYCSVNINELPINSYGQTSLKYDVGPNTVIDRGQDNPPRVFTGKFIYAQESFGRTLYIYEGNSLRARIINPVNVEFHK